MKKGHLELVIQEIIQETARMQALQNEEHVHVLSVMHR